VVPSKNLVDAQFVGQSDSKAERLLGRRWPALDLSIASGDSTCFYSALDFNKTDALRALRTMLWGPATR